MMQFLLISIIILALSTNSAHARPHIYDGDIDCKYVVCVYSADFSEDGYKELEEILSIPGGSADYI